MRKFFLTLAVVAVAATMGNTAKAGLYTSALNTADGLVDTLEDNSRGLISDTDGSTTLSVGDVVYGLVRIDRAQGGIEFSSTEQLVFAYSFTVAATPLIGGLIPAVVFAPTPSANPLSIASLLGDAHQVAAGLPADGVAGFWDAVSFVLMEKTPASTPTNDTTTAGSTLIGSVLSSASGYTLDLVGGFGTAADFFHALLTGGPGLSIPAIIASGEATTLGTMSGGFSIFYSTPGLTYLPVAGASVIPGFPGGAGGPPSTLHDLSLTSGSLSGYSPSNWHYQDKANINVNAVPEPATFVLWAGLFGGMACFNRIRRRRNVA